MSEAHQPLLRDAATIVELGEDTARALMSVKDWAAAYDLATDQLTRERRAGVMPPYWLVHAGLAGDERAGNG